MQLNQKSVINLYVLLLIHRESPHQAKITRKPVRNVERMARKISYLL